jgi:hypothetical protein
MKRSQVRSSQVIIKFTYSEVCDIVFVTARREVERTIATSIKNEPWADAPHIYQNELTR